MPFTATIAPAPSSRRVSASAPEPVNGTRPSRTRRSVGPQSGQATVCAWKRRSAGSRYSVAQRVQSGSCAIVVAGRSYGSSTMIVNRGPQFVQLMNGCR